MGGEEVMELLVEGEEEGLVVVLGLRFVGADDEDHVVLAGEGGAEVAVGFADAAFDGVADDGVA